MKVLSPLWEKVMQGNLAHLLPSGTISQGSVHNRLQWCLTQFTKAKRESLVFHLQEDMQAWGACTNALGVVKKLLDPQAVCVVVGQQAGLLGGSALSVYKAWSAVGWAARLQLSMGVPVVPIFWIPGDDSDLAECNYLAHPWQRKALHLPFSRKGESLLMGERVFPENSARRVEQFCADWLDAESRELLQNWLVQKDHHNNAPGPVSFMAQFLLHIFGSHGLLVLNAARPWVRELEQVQLRGFVQDATLVAELLRSGIGNLLNNDINLSKGSLPPMQGNTARVFAVEAGLRRRLYPGEPLSDQEFSHDVYSRIPCTDGVLPVLAHILGPGELRYFVAGSRLWPWLGRPAPLVQPRCSVRISAPWQGELAEILEVPGEQIMDWQASHMRSVLAQKFAPNHNLSIPATWYLGKRTQALQGRLQHLQKWYWEATAMELAQEKYPQLQNLLVQHCIWNGGSKAQERSLPAALFLQKSWHPLLNDIDGCNPYLQTLGIA